MCCLQCMAEQIYFWMSPWLLHNLLHSIGSTISCSAGRSMEDRNKLDFIHLERKKKETLVLFVYSWISQIRKFSLVTFGSRNCDSNNNKYYFLWVENCPLISYSYLFASTVCLKISPTPEVPFKANTYGLSQGLKALQHLKLYTKIHELIFTWLNYNKSNIYSENREISSW